MVYDCRSTRKPDTALITNMDAFACTGNKKEQSQQMRGSGWLTMALTMKGIWFINVKVGN